MVLFLAGLSAFPHHPNLQSPKNLEKSKYDYLMKTFKPISKEIGNDILEVSNDEIKPVSEMNNDNQKLVFSTILFVKRTKSYSNGLFGWSGEVTSSETIIVKGEKGGPGVIFKLIPDGYYNLQDKKVFNLDTQDDYEDDDDYNKRVQDLKSMVSKECLNGKFLKKSKDGSHFDLSQMVIKTTEPYSDGLFSDNDLVSRAYVDTVAVSKAYVHSGNGMRDVFNLMEMAIWIWVEMKS